jgi:transposase
MLQEHQGDYASQWSAIQSISAKIGCTAETLRRWVRQAEKDSGEREGLTITERERLKALEREVRELRQANEIFRKASVGSLGDSYDNALAETINELYKTEVVNRQSWKRREAVELATLAWVDCFNHRRLLDPIGNIPPPRPKQCMIDNSPSLLKQHDSQQSASRNSGAVHCLYTAT